MPGPLLQHNAFTDGQLHRVARPFADAAALAAFVPVAGDVGKLYKQVDTGVTYELTNHVGPVYEVFNAPGIAAAPPAAHTSTHAAGGSDAVKLDDLAAPDDNTDLNASTTAHGLLVKATAPAAGLINVVGIANAETAYTNKALFDATTPAALAAAAATGTATVAARRDHVHAVPKIDDLAAADDNTDLNASTTAHGLAPKASAPAAGLLSVLGIGNGETVRTDKALFDTTNPEALGTAAPGTSLLAARRDHVHALPASPVCIQIACSDETTALTTGVAKVTFRAPYAFTLTGVRASVTTAPTGGTLLTVDINEAGTTLLSTKLTFDASEKTTVTAATPAVISDSAIADDAEITIDIDAVGSTIAGAGLKVTLIGTKP